MRGTRALLRGSALVTAGLAVQGLCKLAASWGLSRYGNAALVGQVGVLLALVSVAGIIASLGLDLAGAVVAGRNHQNALDVAAGGALVAVSLSPIVILLFWKLDLLPSFIGVRSGSGAPGLLLVMALTCGTVVSQCLQSVLVGLGKFGAMTTSNVANGVGWLALVLVARPETLFAASVLLGASIALSISVQLYSIAGFAMPRREWHATVFRECLEFGLRTLFGSILRAVALRSTLVMSARFLAAEQLSVYTLVLSLSESLLLLPVAVGHVVLGHSVAGGVTRSQIQRLVGWIAVGGFVAAAAAMLLGRPLLTRSFGRTFAVGAVPLAILVMAASLHSIGLIVNSFSLGRGRAWSAALSQGSAAVVAIVAGVLLMPRFGAVGSALATMCAYLTFAAVALLAAARPPVTGAAVATGVQS